MNASAGRDGVAVDAEVLELLLALHRLAQLSRGAFDFTAGVLDDAWGFSEGSPHLPARSEHERARALVAHDELVLNPVTGTARLKKPGARVDAGAVLAAHALERARSVLVGRGVRDFVLSCGGDVVVNGRRGERPWLVGVQDPRGPGPFLALPIDTATLGGAVMTSSDNEHHFVAGGTRYHAILDPRTGLPGTRARSVTVIARDAVTAEALSRAVFVLGDKEGLALVDRVAGASAVIVAADNRVVLSKALEKLAAAQALQQRAPMDGP